jgi:DDE family transposase
MIRVWKSPIAEQSSMDPELRLIWIYCVIDEAIRSIGENERVRQRGLSPILTDAEVLTILIWGEMMQLPTDAAIWRRAVTDLKAWFPHIGTEWNFVRRGTNLIHVKKQIQERLFGPSADWNAFDGLPLPVCKNARARRDRRFQGEAAWSYCAAKDERYYGFKAGFLMNSNNEIFRYWIGPANVDEREMLMGTAVGMSGLLLADKGLISNALEGQLAGEGICLTVPYRKNMPDDRPRWVLRQAMRLRRRIETAFSRLVQWFGITRTNGRDFWRWSARILRKILAYNLFLRFERDFASV